MSHAPRAGFEYLRTAVMSASPEQLQVMLLDGAVRFAQRGRECLEQRNFEGACDALERAERIALELGAGLNREVNPPVVDQMRALYNFVYRRLVEANLRHDLTAIDEAIRILRHQRDTWSLIDDKVRSTHSPPPPGAETTEPSAFVAEA